MGRKERREREQKRENYAAKRSSEKRTQKLIAAGVLGVIGAIVAFAGYEFTNMTETPGGPENAGMLGSAHDHAAILVKIFKGEFDFSAPAYQIKSPWIHFEDRNGSTVHKHATGVTLGYLFDSINIGIDENCYTFPDGRNYCTNEDYELKFFINGNMVNDIRNYEIMEDDRILISYGAATPEELEEQLAQLENQQIAR